jgi:hypothetical protein
VREIRQHGSEGGGAEANRPFLPLSVQNRSVARALVARPGLAVNPGSSLARERRRTAALQMRARARARERGGG